MIIRKGIPEDMPSVWELIRELAVYEKEPDAVVINSQDLIRDGFGEKPLFETLVAEENGIIIGMALFYYRYSTWKGKTIHLEDLIVTESMRGRGIGLALYRKVMEAGKKAGVRRIEWNVLDWNQPAIDFYKKTGASIIPDWQVVHMTEEKLTAFLEQYKIL